ncbi:hypothetical protein D3C78_1167860 [compost metagenome]
MAVFDDAVEGVDLLENSLGIFKQQLPFGGRAQASGVALEQTQSIEVLHRLETTTHGRWRQAHLPTRR